MTGNIAEGLARLDAAVSAMENRYPLAKRNEFGETGVFEKRMDAELTAYYREEEVNQKWNALRYLWAGDEHPDYQKVRKYGLDEYLEDAGYGWPKRRFKRLSRLLRRLRVTAAILQGRWRIKDERGLDNPRAHYNAVNVVFWDNSHSGYGYSYTGLKYQRAQHRVEWYSDGECTY